jgi:hypothetical protein
MQEQSVKSPARAAQVKTPNGQDYSEEDIQCHVHYALYPSNAREPQPGDKRQRLRDE